MQPSVKNAAYLDRVYGKQPGIRPSKDRRFMFDAINAATMGTCPRAAVGCVFVRNGHGLVSGYNGSPTGMDHCIDVGCIMEGDHCIRALHAEQNAIIQAAWHGVSIARSTVYITHYPCALCAKMLINLGVVRVVYVNEYAPADGGEFLRLAGIQVERILL